MSNGRSDHSQNSSGKTKLTCCFGGLFKKSKPKSSSPNNVLDLSGKARLSIETSFASTTSSNRAVKDENSFKQASFILNLTDQVQTWKILGSGTFGEVYATKWKGKSIAIKICDLMPNSALHKDCVLEAAIMERLSHPHIVKCYGYSTSKLDNPSLIRFSIAMQFIPGGNLRNYIVKNAVLPMNWDDRYQILCDVINAIEYMHRMNVIHRDLKSANILLDDERRAFICDFGLAIKVEDAPNTECSGTPAWIAPEIFRKETNTPKMDIYSFAMVMWEVADWNRLPFADRDDSSLHEIVPAGVRPEIPEKCPIKIEYLIRCGWLETIHRPDAKEMKKELSTSIDSCSSELIHALR